MKSQDGKQKGGCKHSAHTEQDRLRQRQGDTRATGTRKPTQERAVQREGPPESAQGRNPCPQQWMAGQGPATHLPCSGRDLETEGLNMESHAHNIFGSSSAGWRNAWPRDQMHHRGAPGLPDVSTPSVVSRIQISLQPLTLT